MAKVTAKSIGKVTWTNSNGEVVEFEPTQVSMTENTPDRYFTCGNANAYVIPDNLINITIEGTFTPSMIKKDDSITAECIDWKHNIPPAYPNMSGSARSISAYNIDPLTGLTGTVCYNSNDIKYGYKEVKEKPKMKINMNWLTPYNLQNNDFAPGMLFLYENRSSIFGSEEEVVRNLTVMVINGAVPRNIDLTEYAGGLLVTGFDVPKASHPIINVPLKPAIHHRGTVAQNNPRTIYEYMSDETYGLGLYVGLTVHDVLGSWSSWPVHEYEVNALTAPIGLYPDFSEKFAFITQPMGNWGLQARSQANGDKNVMKFRDGDIIDIPLGAHPSVAGPATRLAYFWAYTGAPRKDF